jgi:hypothetical protein
MSGILTLSDALAGSALRIPLPAGKHRIELFGNTPVDASEVDVVLDGPVGKSPAPGPPPELLGLGRSSSSVTDARSPVLARPGLRTPAFRNVPRGGCAIKRPRRHAQSAEDVSDFQLPGGLPGRLIADPTDSEVP